MGTEAVRSFEVQSIVQDLHDPALYLNRELSHLEFQRRVLEEARTSRAPFGTG